MSTAIFTHSKYNLPTTKREHDKTCMESISRCWEIEDRLHKAVSGGQPADIEALTALATCLLEELRAFARHVGDAKDSPFAWYPSDRDEANLAALQTMFPDYRYIVAHPPISDLFNSMRAAMPHDSTIDEQALSALTVVTSLYMRMGVLS